MGTASWCGAGLARSSVGAIEAKDYPALARLASLYRDEAACRRIASGLSPSVVDELINSRLARVEQNAKRAWRNTKGAAGAALDAVLTDDFRRGRTVQASGFLLAETEAVLMLIRSAAD